MLARGKRINSIRFTPSMMIPEDNTRKGAEHTCSFDYTYLFESVRDWLIQQKRGK